MPDRRLEVFHAAASQMSFTRAAELLQMTQPAVTFQIKQLEEHFGTRLFERAHGRVTLTPEGLKVKDYADRILDLFATLENELQEMASDLRGHLLIGATPTVAEYHLPPVLAEKARIASAALAMRASQMVRARGQATFSANTASAMDSSTSRLPPPRRR